MFRKLHKIIYSNSLLGNSVNLMFSAGITALFGFVFWIVIARTFSSETIGLATTLLAVSGLLSLLGLLGFDTVFIRFLPKSRHKNEQINSGLLITGIASMVVAIGFCVLIPLVSPSLSFVTQNLWNVAIFAVVTVFTTWNSLTNAALIAYRRTSLVVAINIVFSLIKLALPFVFHGSGPMAIFLFVGIAQVANVLLSVLALHHYNDYHPALKLDRRVLRETKQYGSAVYVAHLLNLLPDSIMPILVINMLGATAGAYFYIAFSIANLLYTIAYATNQALLAESANDEAQFAQHARRGLLITSSLMGLAIIVIIALAPFILSLFGQDYRNGSLELLRIFCLASIPIMLYSFITFIFRHTKNLRGIVVIAAVDAVLIIGLAFPFIDRYGLAGVGWAYVVGNTIAVLCGVWLVAIARTKKTRPKSPQNIIISHFYSTDNCGDAALVSVLAKDTKKAYPGAQITILATDTLGSATTFESTPLQSSFMFYAMHRYRSKPATLLYAFCVMSATTAWMLVHRFVGVSLPLPKHFQKLCELYAQADMVVLVGGGYLRGQGKGVGSFLYCALMVHPLILSRIMHTPSYLYSQSVGPFSSQFESWWVSRVLKRCSDAIFLREDISYELLKDQGLTKIYRAVDSGFAFTSTRQASSTLRQRFGIGNDKLVVGMTAKKYLRGSQQQAYEKTMSDVVRHIVTNHNAAVVFIPQVTARYHEDDDRKVHANVQQYLSGLPNVYDIDTKMDVSEVRVVYEELDLMIGTRFHSVIFSLSSFVPAIAIEYEHKTSGIMKDLDLEKWTVKIDNLQANEVNPLFDQLVKERQTYKKHLEKLLPAYIARAHEPITKIQKLYEQNT